MILGGMANYDTSNNFHDKLVMLILNEDLGVDSIGNETDQKRDYKSDCSESDEGEEDIEHFLSYIFVVFVFCNTLGLCSKPLS